MDKLKALYSDSGKERCGFIVNEEIVEVENIAPEPEQGFGMKAADIVAYAEKATATWHTHPGVNANLSADDHAGFLNWPSLIHHVIGSDGVRSFRVKNGAVVEA